MITIAAIMPHAPILLPDVGSGEDHSKLRNTLEAIEAMKKRFEEVDFDEIIITSPHEDWGFNVPLHLLVKSFEGKIHPYLVGPKQPKDYFKLGTENAKSFKKDTKYAIISSGDLSHALKEEGPYKYHPDGVNFDQEFVKLLEEKNVDEILTLNEEYPEAAECGLRSFALTFGLLEGLGEEMNPEILSYEGPFGVGYLVAQLV